jgi:hypothetical protein
MSKAPKKSSAKETDSVYFLKMLIYFVLGTIWVKHNGYVILPVGAILGVVLAQKDHFATDRRHEYPMLIVSAVIGLIGWGLYLAV